MNKLIFPLCVAGALFLAACGGEKKADATAQATDSTATAATTDEAAAAATPAEETTPAAEEPAPAAEATPSTSSKKSSGSKTSTKETAATAPAEAAPTKKIIGMAQEMGRFSQLTKAVEATGQAAMLGNDGPFVLFAPNDEAFAKIPGGTMDTYLKPENKNKLTKILAIHVAKGNGTIEELAAGGPIATFNGKNITVKKVGSKYMVGKAQVVNANIKCKNGIIHELDAVLLPADFN